MERKYNVYSPVRLGAPVEENEAWRQAALMNGAMLEKGVIQFRAFAWSFGLVDMAVTSELFADRECILSVRRDDWDEGPKESVAKELARSVFAGKMTFVPLVEQ